MNSRLLTLCLMALMTAPVLLPLSSANAQPPGMMGYPMDEEARERMWGNGEMMRGYGNMGSYYGGRGMMGGSMMYGPMMGGSMMGGPMMGAGPMMGMGRMMGDFSGLDLSREQRAKIRAIMQENRKRHLEMMGKMLDASDKLSDLYDSDTPDPDKIGKVYDDVFSIQKQMIQEGIRSHNKVFDVLTKEQRENYRKRAMPYRFGMMGE